jgi:hypothetical protein
LLSPCEDGAGDDIRLFWSYKAGMRPKQPKGQGRGNTLRIRLTMAERAALDAAAARDGRETSTWARAVLGEIAANEPGARSRAELLALAAAYMPGLRFFLRFFADLSAQGKQAVRRFFLAALAELTDAPGPILHDKDLDGLEDADFDLQVAASAPALFPEVVTTPADKAAELIEAFRAADRAGDFAECLATAKAYRALTGKPIR